MGISNNIDQVFAKATDVTSALNPKGDPLKQVKTMKDYNLAYVHFMDLLNLVINFCHNEVPKKIFSDEEVAGVLLTKEIDLKDHKKALSPLKIHLWQLKDFAHALKSNLKQQFSNRYEPLYLDAITDFEEVISAYEYVLALNAYYRELKKFKIGRASKPTEPIRRMVNVHRNPFISSFERREVIWSLFWLEQFNSIEYLSFRDIRPHAAILGRQCLELIWRDVIGFKEIVDQAGNRLNQFTQVAWKFISSYKTKSKDSNKARGTDKAWSITLPLPIRVIDCINTWCNSFTHEPFINMIHVQWYVVKHLQILTQPVNKKHCFTTKHSEIYVKGLRPMRREFEEFVIRQKSSANVNWQSESYDEGAFIESLGHEPSSHLLKKIRLKLICKNLWNIIKAFFTELPALFHTIFTHS